MIKTTNDNSTSTHMNEQTINISKSSKTDNEDSILFLIVENN
jgi:hypothetical protein